MRFKLAGLVNPASRCGAALLLILSLGCSSSLFTGDISSDQKNSRTQLNSACYGINLSEETLDVPSTRGLIRCLNSNGAIQAYEELLNKLSDEQVQSITNLINEEILKNKRLLKDLDKSFGQMSQDGLLDETFAKLGKVLEKTKFVTSIVKLLRETVTTRPSPSDVAKIDPGLLKSLQILADEIGTGAEARRVSNNALELGMRTTGLESYHQIVKGLRLPILLGYPGLEKLTRQSVDYFKAKINSDHALGKLLLWGMADKTLFSALDEYFYKSCENKGSAGCSAKSDFLTLDEQVQALDHFMRFITPIKPLDNLSREDDVLGRLAHLYRVMDDSIECLDGTKEVTNADMYVMEEFLKQDPIRVPYWTLRENMLKLKAASSLCDYPANFNELLDVLKVLGDSSETDGNGHVISRRHLVTITHFLKALQTASRIKMSDAAFADLSPYFYFSKTDKKNSNKKTVLSYPQEERYVRFLIHWLGDKDGVNFVTSLSDALAELSRKERSVLANSLYLLNVAGPESADRENLSKAAEFLMKVRAQLRTAETVPGTDPSKGRSVYDVFTKLLKNVDASVVYDILLGAKDFIDSDEEFVAPFLTYGHRALWINDRTPFLDLILASARKAEQYEPLFNTLIQVSTMPEFENAIALTAKMAQDGALKDLLQGILMIYRKSVESLPGEPVLTPRPAVAAVDAERNKSTLTQVAWQPTPAFWPTTGAAAMNSCKDLNLDFGFADTAKSGWVGQLKTSASCVNAEGKYPEIPGLAEYAVSKEVSVKNGKSLGVFTADLLSTFFELSFASLETRKKAYDEFSDVLIDPTDKADLKEFRRFMPFLLKNKYCSFYDKQAKFGDCPWNYERVSVVQGLNRSFSLVTDEASRLQSLADFGAWALEHRGVPRTVGLLYNSFSDAEDWAEKQPIIVKPSLKPPLYSKPLNAFPKNQALYDELRKSIRKYEEAPEAEVEARVIRKTWEYWNQVRAGEQIYGYRNAKDFKDALAPFLKEFSRENVLEWFLTFLFKFDSNPYDAAWVENWFHRMSANVRAIPYYYPGTFPGKDKPTVRVVSMLDLMELVVIDADFSLEQVEQPLGWAVKGFGKGTSDVFAIRYLARLAQTTPDGTSKDMQAWLDEMKGELDFYNSMAVDSSIFGPTIKPEVKRRLFNLMQVFEVLPELKATNTKTGKGIVVNDLGFLRDLFRAVLSATPKEHWNSYDRKLNSLSLVSSMIHFGILRNVGLRMWGMNMVGEVQPVRFDHILKLLSESVYVKKNGQYNLNAKTLNVLKFLLMQDRKGEGVAFDDRFVFIGALIDRVFEWLKPDDSARPGELLVKDVLLRSAYNLSLVMDSVYERGKRLNVSVPQVLIEVAEPFLGRKVGTGFLGDNLSLLDNIVTDLEGVYFSQFLLDAKVNNKFDSEKGYVPSKAFSDLTQLALDGMIKLSQDNSKISEESAVVLSKLFKKDSPDSLRMAIDALRNMTDDPEYKILKDESLERINKRVVRWFVNPGDEKVLPGWIRSYLALHLQGSASDPTSDLVSLGLFIGKESSNKSDRFFKQVAFLGEPHYVNAFQDFIDVLSSGISDIYLRATTLYTKTSK